MIALLALLALGAPAPAKSKVLAAQHEFVEAQRDYTRLRKDAERRKYRHNWLNLVARFEAVAEKHPKSAQAAEATLTAGKLAAELSRLSRKREDLLTAQRAFERLLARWPKHALAPEGALALARLYAERRDDPHKARTVLEAALARAPKNARPLREYLALLKPATPPVSVAKKAVKPTVSAKAPTAKPPQTAKPQEKQPALASKEKPAPKEQQAPAPPKKAQVSAIAKALAKVATLPEKPVEPEAAAEADLPEDTPVALNGEAAPSDEVPVKPPVSVAKRIVIDAGHGGYDPGARGRKGLREKDVTLEVAKKLAARLRAAGFTVHLTRENDRYLRLEERTRIANAVGGDLFISLHCNAAPSPKLRGVETYTLNTSANRYAIRLAAQENASSESGISDLQYILADLNKKANTDDSRRLAVDVQRSLTKSLSAKSRETNDLGTKEALFFVLLGVKMPAILLEMGFLSNPEEEKQLRDSAHQELIARAVGEGIVTFLNEPLRVAGIK